MCLNETRHDAAVDGTHLGAGPDPFFNVGTATDCNDPAAGDRERLRGGLRGVDGEDSSEKNQICTSGRRSRIT